MSRIVDELPAVIEIDARIAHLRQQEHDLADRTAQASQRYRRAYAKWEREAVDLELSGKTAKPPPKPPSDHARNIVMPKLRADIERAITDRRRAIIEHADEIRIAVDEQGAAILDEARPLVECLIDLVARLRGIAAAVDEIGDARQALDSRQTTPQRRPPVVDLAGLLHALDAGMSVVVDGRDPRPARTLGMQWSNLRQPVAPSTEPERERSEAEQVETVTVVRTATGAEL